MDEIKEMENLEIEETPEVTDEVTDLVPEMNDDNYSMSTGEKVLVGTVLVTAAVGAATIIKKGYDKCQKWRAKKKEQKESKELDQKMEQHPGFLGKFKKNKTEKTAEEVPEKKE